jgi:tetratricopeptide (TPR) repeat protein
MILLFMIASSACAAAPLEAAEPGQDSVEIPKDQLVALGDELARRGDSQRAAQYLLQALEQGANESQVLPRLLNVYIRDRQYRLAAQRLEDFMRRHPRQLAVRLLLAALYEAVSDYPRALEQYNAIVQGDPNHAEAHFALGNNLLAQGNDRGAADRHFRTYLELAPHGPHAEQAQSMLLSEVSP